MKHTKLLEWPVVASIPLGDAKSLNKKDENWNDGILLPCKHNESRKGKGNKEDKSVRVVVHLLSDVL